MTQLKLALKLVVLFFLSLIKTKDTQMNTACEKPSDMFTFISLIKLLLLSFAFWSNKLKANLLTRCILERMMYPFNKNIYIYKSQTLVFSGELLFQ